MPTIRKPGGSADRPDDGVGSGAGSVGFTGCRLTAVCLARLLAGTVLLVVFRAAATRSSPHHARDRGIDQSSRTAEKEQTPEPKPFPHAKQGKAIDASNVFSQD